ncbi:MAG TPA: hypothetical protein DDY25_02405 [Peptococcaceae bacterium]|jgi:hypothetical protein|nr:hypothetical protein [Syntrophaceticus sp.]MDD4360199.1 hypothetical protein [Syntrophaceticus sp.]HBI26568.1 hypothetical protein [Peptococcaceae bacterium]
MKKRIGLIGLLLVAVMLFMCACAGAQDNDTTATGDENGKEQQEQHEKGDASKDDLTKGNRIVVCQNAELAMEDATVSDVKATAASVQELADKYFNDTIAGEVTLVGTDGYQATMAAKDFLAAKISLDAEGIAPVVWNEDLGGKSQVKTTDYAVTAEGEAIIFPAETITGEALLDKLGLPRDAATYRFVATDDFYLECSAEEMRTAELRVGLDDTINGALPIKKAGGKINDVLYIEIVK